MGIDAIYSNWSTRRYEGQRLGQTECYLGIGRVPGGKVYYLAWEVIWSQNLLGLAMAKPYLTQ